MKTIRCRTCGKMISSRAKRCKYCGTVLKLSPITILIILSFIIFIAGIVIVGILQAG
ncbi:MAG: hypothetical protein K8R49_07955 [Candidatus Cloacimonetes bacterium]|nr:hypothetical protein [Candidatus Cloacimonadota bacterium]